MLARIGSNLSLVIATLLFASSTLSTIGVAGPVAVPACDDACCVTKNVACKTAVAPCSSCGNTKKCNKGSGIAQCETF